MARMYMKKASLTSTSDASDVHDIVKGILDDNDTKLSLRKDTPIFDGQYSNFTYQNRIREAFLNETP